MAKETAVVLCSGGLNSAVAAKVAAAEYVITLLHVRFPHRSSTREEAGFKQLVEALQPEKHLTIDMGHFAQIGGNARVSKKMQIEDAMAIGESGAHTYIPGMIGTMIGAAFNWADVIRATRIVVGVTEELGPPAPRLATIYPDHSREFLEITKHAYEAASPNRRVTLDMPLIDLKRAEIIKLGLRMGAPFGHTWSCLSSNEEACGACIGCATRNRGFAEAGVPDPLFCEVAGV